uniref:Uncharacterized protein n=1 Tax=Anguilla anguilla TaxID=7936 RepID=A0A0E9T7I3_ANGAN
MRHGSPLTEPSSTLGFPKNQMCIAQQGYRSRVPANQKLLSARFSKANSQESPNPNGVGTGTLYS